MKNKILNFELFKKGTPEQKPEKQVDVAGGMPKTKKEKTFDQVKRAKLAVLDKTEPDYSKVRKMNEDTAEVKAAADKLAVLQKQMIVLQDQVNMAQADVTKAQADAANTKDATTTTTAAPAATPPPVAPALATAPTATPAPATKPA